LPIRTFTDSSGNSWRVWNTHPANPSVLDPELRGGWLTFDHESDRRRLWPIPPNWESFSEERLELACRAATTTRRSDPYGVAVVPEDEET
jgi:hypothetical protein